MAKVEKSFIYANRLHGKPVGESKIREAKGLYTIIGGKPVKKYRMYNGKILVYDEWKTVLEVPDVVENAPATGGEVASWIPISSYYEDAEGNGDDLMVTFNPNSIGPNTSTTETKSHSIQITQDKSESQVTIELIQKINEQNVTWGAPKLNSISIVPFQDGSTIAPASKTTVHITANITQQKTTKDASGTKIEDITQTVPVTYIYGSGVSGVTTSGDGVTIPSRGTVEGDERTAYTITKIKYLALDGNEYEGSKTLAIKQAHNNPYPANNTKTYNLTVNGISSDSYSAAKYEKVAEIISTYDQLYSWPSGSPNFTKTIDCRCDITFSRTGCVADPSYVTGSGYSTITIPANTATTSRDTIITFNNGKKITRTITQTVKTETGKYTYGSPSITGIYEIDGVIPAEGGTVYLYVNYSQKKTTYYTDNTSSDSTITGRSIAVVTNGSIQITGSKIDTDGGIYMKSAGTSGYSSDRHVYTITKCKCTVNGQTSSEYSCSEKVYQEANILSSYGGTTYIFNLTSSSSNLVESGVTSDVISFESYTSQEQQYTSGSAGPNKTANKTCTASITSGSSYATLDNTSSSSQFKINFKANTSSSSRTIKVTITDWEGDTHVITYTQSMNVVTTTLTNVEVTGVTVSEMVGGYVSASGGEVDVYVSLKKTYTTTSAASGSTTTTQTVSPDSITINGSGSASVSGGTIIVDDLEDNITSIATVYTISSIKWSYKDENGKTWSNTYSYSKAIKQEANEIEYGTWSYALSATANQTTFNNAMPVSPSVTVSATRSRTYSYTSNYGGTKTQTENRGWKAERTSGITGDGVNPTSASAGTTKAQITLAGNTSTTSIKSTSFKFTHADDSTKTKTITFTQAKDAVASTSVNIVAYSATAVQAPAGGGDVIVSMQVKKTSTPIYSSGTSGAATVTYHAATVTAIAGSAANSSGATKNGTKITVKSLEKTEKTSAWNVFQVTSVTGTYDGKSYTYGTAFYVTQGPNTKTKTGTVYNLSATGGATGLTAASQDEIIDIVSTITTNYKWTSGAPDSSTANSKCTLTTNKGSLSAYSVTGSGSVTVHVPENTSTTASQTTTVTVTAADGTTKKNISFTQNKDALISTTFTSLVPKSVVAEEVLASGSGDAGASILFTCTATVTKKYYTTANTTSTNSDVSATITSITGSGSATNSGTKITVKSLGKTTTTSQTTVYTISKVVGSYTSNGTTKTATWTGTCYVKQMINSKTTTNGAYSVSLSANPTTGIANTGGASTLTGTCKRAYTNTWTSGASESGYNNAAATITVNKGSLSTSSITGQGTSTWTIPVNATASAQTWTATIKCTNDTSKTKTATVSQNASTYVLEEQQNDIIPQAGGSFNVYVKSTRNGSAFALSKSNVSISGGTGTINTVTADTTHGAGGYKINITGVPANTTSSNKTMNVKVTQPESGKSITVQCIQAGITKISKDVKWLGTFSFAPSLGGSGSNYSRISVSNPIFSAVDDDKYTYTGGTLSNVTFTVVGQNGNNISTKNIGTITVSAGSTANISSYLPASGLTGSTSNIPMYVKVSWTSSKGNTTEQHGIEDNGYMDQ